VIWVDVKYLKMRFLVTLKRTTFYISLSRGLAVAYNVALLASMNCHGYASNGKSSIPHVQILRVTVMVSAAYNGLSRTRSVERNRGLAVVQTDDALHLTFQRLWGRDIAKSCPTCSYEFVTVMQSHKKTPLSRQYKL